MLADAWFGIKPIIRLAGEQLLTPILRMKKNTMKYRLTERQGGHTQIKTTARYSHVSPGILFNSEGEFPEFCVFSEVWLLAHCGISNPPFNHAMNIRHRANTGRSPPTNSATRLTTIGSPVLLQAVHLSSSVHQTWRIFWRCGWMPGAVHPRNPCHPRTIAALGRLPAAVRVRHFPARSICGSC